MDMYEARQNKEKVSRRIDGSGSGTRKRVYNPINNKIFNRLNNLHRMKSTSYIIQCELINNYTDQASFHMDDLEFKSNQVKNNVGQINNMLLTKYSLAESKYNEEKKKYYEEQTNLMHQYGFSYFLYQPLPMPFNQAYRYQRKASALNNWTYETRAAAFRKFEELDAAISVANTFNDLTTIEMGVNTKKEPDVIVNDNIAIEAKYVSSTDPYVATERIKEAVGQLDKRSGRIYIAHIHICKGNKWPMYRYFREPEVTLEDIRDKIEMRLQGIQHSKNIQYQFILDHYNSKISIPADMSLSG